MAADETTETENPDAEPELPIEGDDDDEQEHEEAQPTPAPDTGPSTEAKMRAADKENRRYHAKLEKILGEDPNRHECAACGGLGVAWGEVEDEVPMVHPENLVECTACNGYGQIITGSRNPDHALSLCLECAGNGYKTEQRPAPNVYQMPEAPAISAQQAQMGTMMPDGTFVPFGAPPPSMPLPYTP